MGKCKVYDVMLRDQEIWLSEDNNLSEDDPDTVIFGKEVIALDGNTAVELCEWIRDGYEYLFLDATVIGSFPDGYASIHEFLRSHGMSFDSSIWKIAPNAVSAGTENARMQCSRPYDASLFFKALQTGLIDRNGRILSKEARRKTQTQNSGFLRYCRKEAELSAKGKPEQ